MQNEHNTRKTTRAAWVCRQLAAEIIAGDFRPGTRLDEMVQSSRMGVSRTPLREAVRQLCVLGLVENRPHRGVVVTDGVGRALFETLEEVGVLCVRGAIQRMTPSQRQEMLRLASDGPDGPDGDDWLAVLHRGCGNQVLAGMMETLWRPILSGAEDGVLTALGGRVARMVADGNGDGADAAMRDFVRAHAALYRHAKAPGGDGPIRPAPVTPEHADVMGRP